MNLLVFIVDLCSLLCCRWSSGFSTAGRRSGDESAGGRPRGGQLHDRPRGFARNGERAPYLARLIGPGPANGLASKPYIAACSCVLPRCPEAAIVPARPNMHPVRIHSTSKYKHPRVPSCCEFDTRGRPDGCCSRQWHTRGTLPTMVGVL